MTPPTPGRMVIEAQQNASSLSKNADWFADNEFYKNTQQQLEIYRFIALAAAHETADTKALLDIGNGGLFEYPIAHIGRVVATDVFVEDTFAEHYPAVDWRRWSARWRWSFRALDTSWRSTRSITSSATRCRHLPKPGHVHGASLAC
jgi:hypothetical protein